MRFPTFHRIQRLSFRGQKGYLKLAFLSDDLLSHYFTIFARRLYGWFLKKFFVGREILTGKVTPKGWSARIPVLLKIDRIFERV